MRSRVLPLGAVAMVGAAAVLSSGCGSSRADTEVASHLSSGEWLLERAASSLGSRTPGATTIRFSPDGTVSGTGPCNPYRGTYEVTASAAIRISDLSQGQRSCGLRADAAEREYLDTLTSVDAVAPVTPGRLTLTGPGTARLGYSMVDVASAITGQWEVVNVSRDDAIRGVSPGLDPVVTFRSDGGVAMSGACGGRTGTWSLEDDRLSVTGLAPGTSTCEPGEDAARDEAGIATALGSATGVAVTPTTLTVIDGEGQILLVGSPVTDPRVRP